jgi:hypothetical protein
MFYMCRIWSDIDVQQNIICCPYYSIEMATHKDARLADAVYMCIAPMFVLMEAQGVQQNVSGCTYGYIVSSRYGCPVCPWLYFRAYTQCCIPVCLSIILSYYKYIVRIGWLPVGLSCLSTCRWLSGLSMVGQ